MLENTNLSQRSNIDRYEITLFQLFQVRHLQRQLKKSVRLRLKQNGAPLICPIIVMVFRIINFIWLKKVLLANMIATHLDLFLAAKMPISTDNTDYLT